MRNRIIKMQQSRRRQQFSKEKQPANRYAVKIPFDDSGDMLYVTEGDCLLQSEGDSTFHLRPLLFNSIKDAQEHAKLWGEKAIVVDYDGDGLL